MYREKWVADGLAGRSVLSLALDVHMTARGTLERPVEDQEQDVVLIREILKSWHDGDGCAFDELVYTLLRVALREAAG